MERPTIVEIIKLDLLEAFPNHPYRVVVDKDMETLAQSIVDHGITSPLILWEYEPNRYIILSGHRRATACLLINDTDHTRIYDVPAIVYRNITLEEATVIMVDENARREKLLPSEKAWAYRMKLDAMKRQGKRTDLTSGQIGTKSDFVTSTQIARKSRESASQIGEAAGESTDNVRRYIRLTYLIIELLNMVDSGVLGFICGVELSYLSEREQKKLYEEMQRTNLIPNLKQAKLLKAASYDKELDEQRLVNILSEIRLDDRVTFRLQPGQRQLLDEMSKGSSTNRSELLRTYASTGGTVYVGVDTVDSLSEVRRNIANIGNLLQANLKRLDAFAENPFLVSEDRAAFLETLAQTRALHGEVDKLRLSVRQLRDDVNVELDELNGKKPKCQI